MILVIDTASAVGEKIGTVVSRHRTIKAAQTSMNALRRRALSRGEPASLIIRREYLKRPVGWSVDNFHVLAE